MGHYREIHAGQSYPVREAMKDEEWAKSLELSRSAGVRDNIETAYNQTSYLHFDHDVQCRVLAQDEVDAPQPVACVIESGDDQGETVYATDIATGVL